MGGGEKNHGTGGESQQNTARKDTVNRNDTQSGSEPTISFTPFKHDSPGLNPTVPPFRLQRPYFPPIFSPFEYDAPLDLGDTFVPPLERMLKSIDETAASDEHFDPTQTKALATDFFQTSKAIISGLDTAKTQEDRDKILAQQEVMYKQYDDLVEIMSAELQASVARKSPGQAIEDPLVYWLINGAFSERFSGHFDAKMAPDYSQNTNSTDKPNRIRDLAEAMHTLDQVCAFLVLVTSPMWDEAGDEPTVVQEECVDKDKDKGELEVDLAASPSTFTEVEIEKVIDEMKHANLSDGASQEDGWVEIKGEEDGVGM